MTAEECKNIIKKKMSKKRYIHSLNVCSEAVRLAAKYGGDNKLSELIKKAEIAGLLHDITKEADVETHLKIFKENNVILNSAENATVKLWHALSGSAYIQSALHINDQDILNAVKYHTTGRKNMSVLEKIIFVADFTSRERDYKDADIIRKKANINLEDAMLYGISFSLTDLINRQYVIAPNSFELYNQLIIKQTEPIQSSIGKTYLSVSLKGEMNNEMEQCF